MSEGRIEEQVAALGAVVEALADEACRLRQEQADNLLDLTVHRNLREEVVRRGDSRTAEFHRQEMGRLTIRGIDILSRIMAAAGRTEAARMEHARLTGEARRVLADAKQRHQRASEAMLRIAVQN